MLSIAQAHQLTGHTASIFALATAEEPFSFFSADGNGWVVKWDLRQKDFGQAIAQVPSNVFSLRFLPSLQLLAVGSMQGTLYFIDLDNNKVLEPALQFEKSVYCFETHQNLLYVGTGAGELMEIDPLALTVNRTIAVCNQSIRSIDQHPTLPLLALGCSNHSIYLVNLDTFQIIEELVYHKNSVFSVRFSPDGRYLLSGSRDAFLGVWEINAEQAAALLHTIPAHLFTINSITYLSPLRLFASASRDKSIKIWDADTFTLLKVIDNTKPDEWTSHKNSVNCLLWLPKAQLLVSGGDDRNLFVWQITE